MVDQSETTILKLIIARDYKGVSESYIRIYVKSIAVINSIVVQLEEEGETWTLLEYNEVQLRLESLDEAEGCDRDFEEMFYALSAKIHELISLPPLQTSIFSPSSSSARDSDRGMYVRLPKLNLPTFSDKYDE